MKQQNTPPSNSFPNHWLQLFLPDLSEKEFANSQQTRLLVQLALLAVIVSIGLDFLNWLAATGASQQTWIKYVLIAVVLLLNRMNYYRPAALLGVALTPLVVFLQLFLERSDVPITVLNYLVIGVLVSSLLLSLKETAVTTFIILASLLTTPLLFPNTVSTYAQIIPYVALIILTSTLLIIFMYQRNLLETHRQTTLQQSQEQLRMTLDAAKMGTWHWEIPTGQLTWSENTYAIFGLTPENKNINYHSFLNTIHPDDRAKVENALEEILNKKTEDYNIELRIFRPDGTVRWLQAKGSVHFDEQREPIVMIGLVSDITPYQQAMDALRHSEQRFRALAENIPGVIYLCQNNRQWHMLYLNDMVETLTGYPKDVFLDGTLSFADLYHPDDVDLVYQPVKDSLSEEDPFNLRYRIKHKNGEWRWIEETGIGIKQDNGEWLLEGVLVDVTERKQVELALQQSEEMHRLLLASIQTPVLALTETMGILFCNEAYANMVHSSVPILEGQNLLKKFPNFKERPSYKAYQTALETGQPQEVEGWFQDVYWYVHVYRTPWGVLALSEDITERQQMLEMREELINELALKNEELERFTYTVSHDLKSPLVTVKGFLGFLEQDALKGDMARVRKDIVHIETAVNRMQVMLNDLLELSRIGRFINPPQDISFRALIQEAISAVAGQIAHDNVEVIIKSETMPIVHGDHPRLVQLLQNLLDNAIKYMGEQTHPIISIGYTKKYGETIFYVQDNGMGIDPQHHHRAFELFERLNRPGDGTGIGLALVKRIIEVHNGRIWIESDGTKGTTFYFTLPVASEVNE